MAINFLSTMMLAACTNGNPDKSELSVIKNFMEVYKPLRKYSQGDLDQAMKVIMAKKKLKVKDKHIIEDLGEEFSKAEKDTAFALAAEVCASNFMFTDEEIKLLELLKDTWAISKTTHRTVFNSIEMRYNTKYGVSE